MNRMRYFRWTSRTAWITFVYAVAVPAAFGYAGFVTDVRPLSLFWGGTGRDGLGMELMRL